MKQLPRYGIAEEGHVNPNYVLLITKQVNEV
jgi:hypothetical protein